MDKIKNFIADKYSSLRPKTKSVFGVIVRYICTFSLCCVAILYCYNIFFADENSDKKLLLEVYDKLAAEKGVDLSNYDFSNMQYLGTVQPDGTKSNIADGIEQDHALYKSLQHSASVYFESGVANSSIESVRISGANVYKISDKDGHESVTVIVPESASMAYENVLNQVGASNYDELMDKINSGEVSESYYDYIAEQFKIIYNAKSYNDTESIPQNEQDFALQDLMGDVSVTALKNLITGGDEAVTVGAAEGFVITASDYDNELEAEELEQTGAIQTIDGNWTTGTGSDAIDITGLNNEGEERVKIEEEKTAAELLGDYLTNEIFGGLGYATAHPLWAAINALLQSFMSYLRLSFWTPTPGFTSEAGLGHGLSGLNLQGGTLGFYDFYQSLMEMFQIIGAVIATLLFVFGLLLCMFGKIEKIKDTPAQLIARFTASLVLIKMSVSIINWFASIIASLWSAYLTLSFFKYGFNIQDLLLLGVPKGKDAAQYWEMQAKAGNWVTVFFQTALMNGVLHTLAMLIGLLIMWPIIKQFFALAIEVIERFLVIVIVYALSPLAYASLVTSSTSNIFRSYLKMLMSQLTILAANNLFVGGFCYLVSEGVPKSSLVGYVFTYSYLKTAQRFDAYLRTMGMSAAQTGGNVMGAMGLAYRNVTRTLSSMNENRKANGQLLASAGSAMGSKALTQYGNFHGMSVKGLTQSLKQGNGMPFSKENAYNQIANAGKKTHANTSDVASSISKFTAGDKSQQQKLKSFSNKSWQNYMKQQGIDMKVGSVNTNHLKDGTIGINGVDKNGNNVSYNLSKDKANKALGETNIGKITDKDGVQTGYINQTRMPDSENGTPFGNDRQTADSSGNAGGKNHKKHRSEENESDNKA